MSIYDPALTAAAGNAPFRDYGSDDPAAAADEPTFSDSDPVSQDADSFSDISVPDVTTSSGDDGPSSNPPDNGGYNDPPRPDRTGSGGGSSSVGSDPVSSGGGELDPAAQADEPTFSENDPLYSIGEQVEESTGGNVPVNDFLDSVLKAGGTFTTGVGGTTEGQDLEQFEIPDEILSPTEALQNFPLAVTPESVNRPLSDSGPSWLTVGVAAVAAVGAGLFFSRRQS